MVRDPTFEDDMLEPGELPNPALRHEVEEKLESLSEQTSEPRNPPGVEVLAYGPWA